MFWIISAQTFRFQMNYLLTTVSKRQAASWRPLCFCFHKKTVLIQDASFDKKSIISYAQLLPSFKSKLLFHLPLHFNSLSLSVEIDSLSVEEAMLLAVKERSPLFSAVIFRKTYKKKKNLCTDKSFQTFWSWWREKKKRKNYGKWALRVSL